MLTKAPPNPRLTILQSELLSNFPWLIHGFSTRAGGCSTCCGRKSDLNLGFTRHDAHSRVERNRAAFLEMLLGKTAARSFAKSSKIVSLRQVHSDIIHRVSFVPEHHLVGDGLLTDTPGLLLAVQTADCLPVILVDVKRHAVGVFHAGWRGTVKRIVEKGVGEMRRWFGSRAQDLKAAIGPGVHSCCYDVGAEVREKFESQFAYSAELFREVKESDPIREKYPLLFLTARAPGHSELPKKIFLDLVEANRQQLLAVGVAKGNIWTSPLCTSCRSDILFSYRAEKGKTGRLMGVVGLRRT